MYGRAIGNAQEVQRLYRPNYPNRRQPQARTFQAVHRRLGETGGLRPVHHVGRPRSIRTVEMEEEVLAHVQEQPSTRTRAIAHAIGMYQTVCGISRMITSCTPIIPSELRLWNWPIYPKGLSFVNGWFSVVRMSQLF